MDILKYVNYLNPLHKHYTIMPSITIVIVEKPGTLKLLTIKDFVEEDLFKKCGFKKNEGFAKQTMWSVKTGGKKYSVCVFAKTDGRANSENKYDFPPPIDNTLFFGNCAIVAKENENYINLTLDLWNKIYEKLFGGFEDLATTAIEDELEEDELANVPKEKKTKNGYLKDGFVVDSSDTDEEYESCDESEYDVDADPKKDANDDDDDDDLTDEIDVGSELSEETYDYDKK
jgi:hypothetical protein